MYNDDDVVPCTILKVGIDGGNNCHTLWFDTMASHSITNDKKLFGSRGPSVKCNFNVNGWNDGNCLSVNQGGGTAFGFMLYCENASGTIISGYEVKNLWKLAWKMNDIELTLLRKGIALRFSQNEQDRVLMSIVDEEVYESLCKDANVVACNGVIDDTADVKVTILDIASYQRVLEVIHFHKVTCHAGFDGISWSLRGNLLSNCPIDDHDVRNICFVCPEPCLCCKSAKSVRTSNKPHQSHNHGVGQECVLPDKAYTFNRDDSEGEMLGLDIFFIDTTPYLFAVGLKTGYSHALVMPNRSTGHTKPAIDMVIKDFKRHNIKVSKLVNVVVPKIIGVESDNERAILNTAIELFPDLHISADFVVPGEHVSYVERRIRTLKERVTATRVSLQWIIPPKLVSWLVSQVVTWMNILFSKRSPTSSWRLMHGGQLNYRDLTRTSFGDCVMAHRPDGQSNGQSKGELGISLGANPRQPGAIFFYSLSTQQVKCRVRFIKVLDVDLIKGYKFKANKNRIVQGCINQNYMTYVKHRQGADEGTPTRDDPNLFITPDLDDSSMRTSDNSEGESAEGADSKEPLNGTFFNDSVENENELPLSSVDSVDSTLRIVEDIDNSETKVSDNITLITDDDNKRKKNAVKAINRDPYMTRSQRKENANTLPDIVDSVTEEVYAMALCGKGKLNSNTCNWKKAIAERGEVATEKIFDELKQICITYDVAEPVKEFVENYHNCHDLYDKDKDKARLVIGKAANHMLIDYGVDTNSPTINGKVINLMLSIAVHHDLELEVWDVKGAFLKSPLHTDGVYVKARGPVAEKMVEVRPDWKKYLKPDGSLMLRCKKGWYGLSVASMLWYEEIKSTLLNDCGMIQNEMEPCLFHKGEGKDRMYIMLHVDDMGVLAPKDSTLKIKILKILEEKYEKLKVQTGEKVKYIGLEIFRDRGNKRIEVDMNKFISKLGLFHGLGPEITKTIRNPAKNIRFSKPLAEGEIDKTPFNDTMLYRSLVMSMQYATTVLPSVKYHVIYLATKQVAPLVADYKAAIHVLKYMLCKKNKPLHIYACGDNPDIYVYHDAAFDVYSDSISHSGISVFVGSGGAAVYCYSGKQKCVTRSSTCAEVVVAEKSIILGSYYVDLMTLLGFKPNIIYYEDNRSVMCLVDTGSRAHDRTSRHMVRKINIMHEYYSDPSNRAVMLWCNTKNMVSDILTKDMHGREFLEMENILMGYEIDYELECDND